MTRFVVEKGVFDGQETFVLKDTVSGLQGTLLPGVGSNLIDLRYVDSDLAILYNPTSMADLEEKAVGWGFPILMPPNRIENGRFTYNGREYVFDINEAGTNNHIHGLVNSVPWKVVSIDTSEAASVTTAIRSDDHPKIKESYPHSFELRMTFSLKGDQVDFLVEAENLGETTMPFGIGFHPYFKVPLTAKSTKDQCTVQVPANKRWELIKCLPTGRKVDLEGKIDLRQPVSLADVMLDDVYTDLVYSDGASTCVYEDRGSGVKVLYGADDQFKHWVVYTGKTLDAPFVCLEPYTWVTNAPNLPLPKEETGLIDLAGGKTFSGRMWLVIER